MVSPLVREVFQYLHHSKIPVGLTSEYTAGEITYVSNILAKAGLSIGPIVGSNDVEHSRPHPDMTLKVAQELGIEELDMSQVIKVDRSLYGLSEGFRAGCRTVGVADLSCMANNRYFPAPLYTSMSSNVAISRYRLNDIKRTMMDAGHIAITDLGELPPLLEDM
jgi:beta-phosphoglucomutase-like phosphatase (HAD superfamily)